MVLAVVLVFVTLVVPGFLIHVVWLGTTYQAMCDDGFSFRAPDALQHLAIPRYGLRMWPYYLRSLRRRPYSSTPAQLENASGASRSEEIESNIGRGEARDRVRVVDKSLCRL